MAKNKIQIKNITQNQPTRRGFLRGKIRAPKDTRAKLIDAARKYLEKSPPETLTYQILERESGMSRQLIVTEFESLNDIVLSVIEELMIRWSKRFVFNIKQLSLEGDPVLVAGIMSDSFLNDLEFCRLIAFAGWAMSKQISAKRATKFKMAMLGEFRRVSGELKKKLPLLSRRDVSRWIYPVFSLIGGVMSCERQISVEFQSVSSMAKFSLVHSEFEETIKQGVLYIVVGSYSVKQKAVN